ncbi:hypothetical protein GW17_00032360 [Ensete ventricosum]|nr:hypothetical protein GW17_00032360 [Ensete ventricosum]
MYTTVAEEGSSSMERETTVVVFNLLLATFKIVGSKRLLRATIGRQQINGSAIWWATSKAIVGIACEGGGMDDSYRGSNVAALIPDDRTPKGAL